MWEDVLKATGILSSTGKKLVESVMTTEPKSINTILEDIYEEIDRRNKNDYGLNSKGNKRRKDYTSGRDVPSRNQLGKYLSIHYSKIFLSNATKKPTKTNKDATAHYYKEE